MGGKLAALLLAALALLLCGCNSFTLQNASDLLRAPALSPGQNEIQQALTDYLNGVEPQYKYPKEGDWLSPLLRADLNGDGAAEAILLYSVADNVGATREKGSNVYVAVLQQQKDGEWVVTHDEQGLNTDVASIETADLLGDGMRQLIVGYSNATFTARTLALYTAQNAVLQRVQSMDYSRYEIGDFTGREGSDLVVVSRDDQLGGLTLRCVLAQNGSFTTGEPAEAVQLDTNFVSCAGIVPGINAAGEHLLVVDGVTSIETGALASQRVFYSGERFYTLDDNAVLRGDSGRINPLLLSRDIDADGVVEIPLRVGRSEITTIRADKRLEYVEWMDFSNPEEEAACKQFGLVDSDRGVYIRLPDSWRGKMRVLDGAGSGEWQIQNSSTMAGLISLRVLAPGGNISAGALLVPGATNTYLQLYGGLPVADREQIAMTPLTF